jgi:hypothetical protein
MMRDLGLLVALVGLFLAPVLPARAGMPICTADGRGETPQEPPQEPPSGCAHLLCERSRLRNWV